MNPIKHPWHGVYACAWILLAGCAAETQAETSPDVPVEQAARTSPEADAAMQPSGRAPDPQHTGNCGGELSEAPVVLSWVGAASRDEITVARGESLALDVHNVSNAPVTTKLFLELNQRGAERSRELPRVSLSPGSRQRIIVDLDALGLARRTRTLGHVGVRATVHDASGTTIMTVYAPSRSFHDAGGGRIAFYDSEVRDRKYGKGDPFGVFPEATRNDPTVLSISFADEAASPAVGGVQ
jgi:hypothetical protein